MDFRPEIELTDDGSATLRSPVFGDFYHSQRGAVGESRHVFVEAGFAASLSNPARILEAGFGTGLNAWLTLLEAARRGRTVEYTGVELYPVPADIAAELGYTEDERFMAMHRAGWGREERITDDFTLTKLNADLTKSEIRGIFDVVYYDAFAPETQPEMWRAELFVKICDAMPSGGILVTYSAKGDVRRALQGAGFEVEKLPGALGKRHMLRAVKI